MKLQTTKILANSVFSSKFELIERNEFDDALLEDYAGSLSLNISGDIYSITMVDDGTGGQKEEYTLLLEQGDKFVDFPACLPLERGWSIAQYGSKAETIANAYTESMEKRIIALVEEIKLKGDNFSNVSQYILTP